MAAFGFLLDAGDKIASIVGAAAGLATLWLGARAGSHFRRRPDSRVAVLLAAQLADAGRHRYRFFGDHVPALSDLYVRSRVSISGSSEGEKPRTVQAGQILTAHKHAVLLGDAGAGKSTFLATVAGDFAVRARSRRGRGDIAVVVPAADLVGRRLPDALARAVHRDLAVELPSEMFERSPVGGSWRVLVDGLDEVMVARGRSDVLWRLKKMLADPGPYRFVLACRPLTAPELAELYAPSVGVYDLRPFDRRELEEFAHRWFAARFPNDRRRADRTAGRFLARIAGARLGPVARVPLLATIAALVYESETDRTLPSSRAALYDRFVDHLLDGRSSLDRFREAIEPDLLARGSEGALVASWLFATIRQQVGALLRACGAAWLTNADAGLLAVAAAWIKDNAPYDLGPDRDRLLRELLLTTGVCTLRRERVVFAHQSFAEYFAAAAEDAAFDETVWMARALDPATRSLAAFAAARRPEPEALISVLVARGEVNAAGDMLADGIPARPEVRDLVISLLLSQIADETDGAPEALRILGDLSIDAEVLSRMSVLARDQAVSALTRALVADRIADIDPAIGHELLRAVAEDGDDVVRAWVADTLHERGGRPDPHLRLPLAADAVRIQNRPLGALARQALTQRLVDSRAADFERVAAARQLARGGELTPLRELAEAADVDPRHRVDVAAALADAGDPSPLRRLATGFAGTRLATYAAAMALFERHDAAAGTALAAIARNYPDRPMSYGAAARCADLGDLEPLIRLAREPGEVHVRLAAARRLAALGKAEALGWLLDEPQAPALEAATLAALLEANKAEMIPRLERLLRRHRFRKFKLIEFRFLLAANGDEPSREMLRSWARRRAGSVASVEAAIALTALSDPRGLDRLQRTAADTRLRQRSRMRAAAAIAQLQPTIGRQVLERLAAPGSPPDLRLRAASMTLGLSGSAGPMVRLVLDETVPAEHRAGAIDVLTHHDDKAVLVRLASLATRSDTPALVRAAAAPLQPDSEARTVLDAIAIDGRDINARVAAIAELDSIDSRAAEVLFGRLLRDQRISRIRRWWLAMDRDELLSSADAAAMDDRLGDSDDRTPQWIWRVMVLLIRRPEDVLGSQTD